MLGPRTQSMYVPERYRDANTFVRFFYKRFDKRYLLNHVAPAGKNIYFVSEPSVSQDDLDAWQDEMWDKHDGNIS